MSVPPWKHCPKICKPRHGQANTKRYRSVKVWQVPYSNPAIKHTQDWTCLGDLPYSGPLRSSIHHDDATWVDGRLVWRRFQPGQVRWRWPGPSLDAVGVS